MALTANLLRPQVHLPVWEKMTDAPANSAATACSCAADNSNFHAQHGRYIYYIMATASFYRYDTWTNTYQQLASPPLTLLTWTTMRFAGAKGYEGRVIAASGNNGIQVGIPFGQTGKTFDIRITDGLGKGQRRIITDVATPVIADYGAATGGATTTVTDSNKAWAFNQWVGYNVRIISGTGTGQVRKIMYNNATVLTIADAGKYPEDLNCNAYWTAPAAGSIYQIESSIITVDTNWGTNPDATSRFIIESGGIYMATSLATSFYSLAYYDILMDTWYIKAASSTMINITGTDATLERTTENASLWDRGIVTATGSDTTHLADTTKNWKVDQWKGYYVRIFTGTREGDLKKIDSNTATILTWTGALGGSPDATSRYLIVGFDAGTCSGASVAESANSVSCTASAYGNVLTVTAVGSGALLQGATIKGTGLGAVLVFSNASSSAAVVTVGSTANVQVGMVMVMISGTGVLTGGLATVISVNSSTTFTITQTPSTPLSGTNVFMLGGGLGNQAAYTSGGGSSSSTTVTVTSTTNLIVGMAPMVSSGTGAFAAGSVVTSITDATHFVVDVAPATPLSGGANVVACFPQPVILGAQLTGATAGGTGTYLIYPNQPVVSSGTVTGNGVAVLVDSTKSTWTTNRWNNMAVRITAGTGKGQIRTIQASIAGYLSVTPDWTTALDTSSTYEIQGDPDKLYLAVAANSSIFIHNLSSDTMTTGRQEAYGSAAGCFVQYSDHPPIAISGGVYSNPNLTVTTVNNHNFKIGQSVTIMGDTGAGKSYNNATLTITAVAAANTFVVNVGASSASMTVPAQSTSILVDSSKNWVINQWAGCIITYNAATPTQATGLCPVFSEIIIGNSSNTLYFARVGTAPVQGITRYSITQSHMCASKSAVGALDAGISVANSNDTTHLGDFTKGWSSQAGNCSSSGTTITTTLNLKGLQVGMIVSVTGGTGVFDALTRVVTLTDDTHFVVDKTPLTALSGATVQGTFWIAGVHNGRRARIIAGTGMFQEWAVTGSTFQTVTMTAITTAPVNGVSAYELLPLPAKGLGIELNWAYGLSDVTKKGSYMYCPRGASIQMDRLNLTNDTWEILYMLPQMESFTTGTQWAYDGHDKIFLVINGTLRMMYLDLNTGIMHGGMMLPYIAGTAVIGNRMEIFSTIDGLNYLWVNSNQSAKECFRALLFW